MYRNSIEDSSVRPFNLLRSSADNAVTDRDQYDLLTNHRVSEDNITDTDIYDGREIGRAHV